MCPKNRKLVYLGTHFSRLLKGSFWSHTEGRKSDVSAFYLEKCSVSLSYREGHKIIRVIKKRRNLSNENFPNYSLFDKETKMYNFSKISSISDFSPLCMRPKASFQEFTKMGFLGRQVYDFLDTFTCPRQGENKIKKCFFPSRKEVDRYLSYHDAWYYSADASNPA